MVNRRHGIVWWVFMEGLCFYLVQFYFLNEKNSNTLVRRMNKTVETGTR